PKGKAGQVMISNPNTASISKDSKLPDQGWELLKYMISDAAQSLENDLGLWQPTSKGLLMAPSNLKRTDPPYDMQPFIPGIQGKTRAPVMIPQLSEVLDTIFKGSDPIFL